MEPNSVGREMLIRCALLLFCLGLWFKELYLFIFPLLVLAWIMDSGLLRLRQLITEPLVQAVVILCGVLLLGLLWGDSPGEGRHKWTKYFNLLILMPFLSLLNKERLPWVIGALAFGYAGVLSTGVYQWVVMGALGVPLFNISYLSFSAILGLSVILAIYFVCISRSISLKILLGVIALALLFLQFNQNGRGILLATLMTIPFLIFLLFRIEIRKLMSILFSLIIVIALFAASSSAFQERFILAKQDITQFQQGNFSTSVGYRLAMWDVGLDAISKRPFLGYGTGNAEQYFDNAIETYKGGIYRDLPKFHSTSHYHHDWIEIGMHLGMLGMLVFAFFLWSWYRMFSAQQLPILGATFVCYIFLAGLSDTFMLYTRVPILLLVVTAVIICWQKEMCSSMIQEKK
jgi:O-antigen ligase